VSECLRCCPTVSQSSPPTFRPPPAGYRVVCWCLPCQRAVSLTGLTVADHCRRHPRHREGWRYHHHRQEWRDPQHPRGYGTRVFRTRTLHTLGLIRHLSLCRRVCFRALTLHVSRNDLRVFPAMTLVLLPHLTSLRLISPPRPLSQPLPQPPPTVPQHLPQPLQETVY